MTETILRALIVIRRRQLEIQLGLARTTIYDKMNPDSPRYDPSFPTPIRLGKGAAVGWLAHEVDDWLNQQIKNSRAGSS
jgi:prophage regulatory protein